VEGVKQPFGLQLGFEAQKLLKQSALPGALHGFDDQLQVTPGFVNPQASSDFNQFAVARRKVHEAGSTAKHGAADLARFVFDGKITMPTGCARKARDLAPNADGVELTV
jgi:hypothetical protein